MKQTFETAMARLEEISQLLAENDVTLDESVKLYNEGVKLLKFCNSKLEQAQIKIRSIDGASLEDN